jgi:hypothetical protein
MKKFETDHFDLKLKKSFYYSADNSMELTVYFMAKEFMERCGDDQFKFYLSKKNDVESIDYEHTKDAIRVYKKLKKAIYAIDEIVKTRHDGYDSIANPKLLRHIDTIWKHRHILWT